MRDSEIEQRVLREVHLEQDIGSKEICVFCLNGIVALAGTVLTDRNYRAAEAAARRATGISAVVNKIRIETHVEAAPPPVVRIPALAAQARTGWRTFAAASKDHV